MYEKNTFFRVYNYIKIYLMTGFGYKNLLQVNKKKNK